MKRDIYGFSFVELIVVVSIIGIFGTMGVFSFLKNGQQQAFLSELTFINNKISYLDRSVGKDITDYRVSFISPDFYLINTNTLYKNKNQEISFSGSQGNISLQNSSGEGLYKVILYKNNKYILEEFLTEDGIFMYDFSQKGEYKIEGYVDQNKINTLQVIYFGENRLGDETKVQLSSFGEDKIDIYRHISGQKTILFNEGNVSQVQLEFEKAGLQQNLIINNTTGK